MVFLEHLCLWLYLAEQSKVYYFLLFIYLGLAFVFSIDLLAKYKFLCLVQSLILHFYFIIHIIRTFLLKLNHFITFLFLKNVCEAFQFQIFLFLALFRILQIFLLFIRIVLIIILKFFNNIVILLFSFATNFLYFIILFLKFLFFQHYTEIFVPLLSIFLLFD